MVQKTQSGERKAMIVTTCGVGVGVGEVAPEGTVLDTAKGFKYDDLASIVGAGRGLFVKGGPEGMNDPDEAEAVIKAAKAKRAAAAKARADAAAEAKGTEVAK